MYFNKLFYYLAKNFLIKIIIVSIIALCFIYIGIMLDYLRETEMDNISIFKVITVSLLKEPDMFIRTLPFCFLFASLLTFMQQSKSNELVVMQSCGMSAWKIITPLFLIAFTVGLACSFFIIPATASLAQKGRALLVKTLQENAQKVSENQSPNTKHKIIFPSQNVEWFVQKTQGNLSLFHFGMVGDKRKNFHTITMIVMNADNSFKMRIDAKSGQLTNNNWYLRNVYITKKGEPSLFYKKYHLPTSLSPGYMIDKLSILDTLHLWSLKNFIHTEEEFGFPAFKNRVHFYKLLSIPIFLMSIIFYMAAFFIKIHKGNSYLFRASASIAIFFTMFFIREILTSFGIAGVLPPLIAVFSPIFIFLFMSIAFLIHVDNI